MEKRKRLTGRAALCALALAALPVCPAAAQLYRVDALFGDSVQTYELAGDGGTAEVGAAAFKVADGDTLLIEGRKDAKSQYGVFSRGGTRCLIHSRDLVFCSDNAEETTDLFPLSTASRRHTPLAHFFAHPASVSAVGVLLLLSLLLCLLGRWARPARKPALAAAPLCLLSAVLLSLAAYYALGGEALWWCDPGRYGFFPSLLRMLPFAAAVAYLFCSFRLYRAALFAGRGERASLRLMAVSVGACVPAAALWLIVGWFCGLAGDALAFSAAAVFFLALLGGTVFATLRNARRFGTGAGLALTVFAGVYVAACSTALGAVALSLLNMPWQTLVFAVLIGFAVAGVRGLTRRAARPSVPAAAVEGEVAPSVPVAGTGETAVTGEAAGTGEAAVSTDFGGEGAAETPARLSAPAGEEENGEAALSGRVADDK